MALMIFYIIVVLMSIFVFSMKITASSAVLKLILVTFARISSAFTLVYSMVQLLKMFGMI